MWISRGPGLEDLDGANFLMGLSHFSLAQHQPHFPGYPVYLAASWIASVGIDAVSALQLPGVLGWGLGLGLFHRALAAHTDERTAWIGWMLLVLSPLAWITAGRTGSDAMGTGLALAAASALALGWSAPTHARRWSAMAGLLGALALGARPALFPWIGGLAMVALGGRHRMTAMGGFAGGLAAWGAPFLAVAGPDLVQHGQDFVVGHFTRWGGAATVADADPIATRALQFSRLLLRYGFGSPMDGTGAMRWVAAVFWLSGLAAGARLLRRTQWVALLAVGLPFVLWLWVGQNPEKPRHVLPLMPLMATVAAVGLTRADNRVLALGFFGLGSVGLRTAALHHQTPSPEAQLAAWLGHNWSPDQVRLFCGQSERVIVALHPSFRSEYTADAQERDRRLGLGPPPPTLMWTDEVAGFEHSPQGFSEPIALAHFARAIEVDPHRPTLTVYSATPLFGAAIVAP
jgi:hypothetical protein